MRAVVGFTSALVVLAMAIPGSVRASADEAMSPEQAYLARCGACHEPIQGPSAGVWMLRSLRGADKAQLSSRDDLDAGYIRTVVRRGLTVMPPMTRAEITDEELETVILYLTRERSGS